MAHVTCTAGGRADKPIVLEEFGVDGLGKATYARSRFVSTDSHD